MGVEWARLKRSRQIGDSDAPDVKAQRVYLVKCTSSADGPEVAIAATAGLSASYSLALPGLKIVSRDCRELDEVPADGGTLYEVTLKYATKSEDPEQQEENPLDRPPVVRLSFDSFEETVYRHKDATPEAEDGDGAAVNIAGTWLWGKAVCNSAGKAFDPSISDCFRDPVVTITRNMNALPWTTAIEYVDTINSDNFNITYRGNTYSISKGQAWLYDISTESRYENEVQYEEVTFVIKLRKDGWKRKVLDQGLEGYIGDDPSAKKPPPPILDEHGDPIQVPALLDGKGSKVGSPGAGTKPVWLKFRLKEEKAFASLPI